MRQKRFIRVVAAFALLSSVPAAAHAQLPGLYTFDWVGNCEDCAMAAGRELFEVRARLQVQNYILGSALSNSHLVRFDYFGSNLVAPYAWIPDVDDGSEFGGFSSIEGSINTATGFYAVRLRKRIADGDVTTNWRQFNTASDGSFNVRIHFLIDEDFGTGTWNAATTTVPEPESWAMMLFGLAALGVAKRQRKKVVR
jgi:PEP-CTERM motif